MSCKFLSDGILYGPLHTQQAVEIFENAVSEAKSQVSQQLECVAKSSANFSGRDGGIWRRGEHMCY